MDSYTTSTRNCTNPDFYAPFLKSSQGNGKLKLLQNPIKRCFCKSLAKNVKKQTLTLHKSLKIFIKRTFKVNHLGVIHKLRLQ